jgi:hypothetical protein
MTFEERAATGREIAYFLVLTFNLWQLFMKFKSS